MADISLDMQSIGVVGSVDSSEEEQTKAKRMLGRLAKDEDDKQYLMTALGLIPDPEAKPMRHGK